MGDDGVWPHALRQCQKTLRLLRSPLPQQRVGTIEQPAELRIGGHRLGIGRGDEAIVMNAA